MRALAFWWVSTLADRKGERKAAVLRGIAEAAATVRQCPATAVRSSIDAVAGAAASRSGGRLWRQRQRVPANDNGSAPLRPALTGTAGSRQRGPAMPPRHESGASQATRYMSIVIALPLAGMALVHPRALGMRGIGSGDMHQDRRGVGAGPAPWPARPGLRSVRRLPRVVESLAEDCSPSRPAGRQAGLEAPVAMPVFDGAVLRAVAVFAF